MTYDWQVLDVNHDPDFDETAAEMQTCADAIERRFIVEMKEEKERDIRPKSPKPRTVAALSKADIWRNQTDILLRAIAIFDTSNRKESDAWTLLDAAAGVRWTTAYATHGESEWAEQAQ
jgi:hypothetical protein